MIQENTLESKRFRIIFFYIVINFLIALILYFSWPAVSIFHRLYVFIFFLIWFTINFFYMYKFALPKNPKPFNLNEALNSLSALNLPENEWDDFENTKQKLEIQYKHTLEKLESETEKFDQLLNSIPSPVFILNNKQQIVLANRSFSTCFGLQFFFYKSSPPLLSVLRVHELEELSIKTQNENKTYTLEFNYSPNNDHNYIYFDSYLSPFVFNKQDSLAFSMCLLLDTTERRLTDKMREEFVANVSHEIRTPLTILMGHIHSLQKGIEGQDQLKDLSFKINANSTRLLSMINELLELSKIESQGRIQKEEMSIDMLIESILFDLKEKYQSLNLEMLTCFDETLAFVNPKLFDQLMLNLLENACKYNRENGAIYVHTFKEDNYLKIIIKDTGIGIPKEQVHRIFERFFRVDSSRSSFIQGTGLGLSIVKHIVQKHHGQIKVQSTVNEGTSFEITLPFN